MIDFWTMLAVTIALLLVGQPLGETLRRWLGDAAQEVRARSPREIGWGLALIPVTVLWLASLGAFSRQTVRLDGAYDLNLFGAVTLGGSVFWSMVTVVIVAGCTVVQPRLAGYLAAAGLAGLGARILLVMYTVEHHLGHWISWDHWLRDQARWPVLAAMGLACLAGGAELTRRTVYTDIRSRRSGLTARVRQLTETRAVAVDSAAAELRRLERDLHDGAQARLVALGINLREAQKLVATSPDEAAALIGECRDASARALNELRRLVRGIYPPVLADRGLGDAVEALALDCPVTAVTDIDLPGRPPAPVESAVYFAVAELLNNAVKHTDTGSIRLRVYYTGAGHDRGMLRASVEDDGSGGASPREGGGLAGIERRLSAFDGILAISSPAGGPTTIVIEVPCALSSPKISIS